MNVLYIVFKGFSKNGFAQLQGPFKYKLRYFRRPLSRSIRTASAKSSLTIEFLSNTSFAICNHWPSHPCSRSTSNLLDKISILVILLLCSVLSTFSNSQPTAIASSTARRPRFAMNCAKSSFPSLFSS